MICKAILTIALTANPFASSWDEQLISEQTVTFTRSDHLEGWHDSYDAALQEAKEKELPLLIAFLGPNWCPSSDQLEAEILTEKKFRSSLEGKAILLKVDLPEDFSLELGSRGRALKQRYGVEECPTLILAKPSGTIMAQLDSLPLDSLAFAGYINELIEDYQHLAKLTEEKGVIRSLEGEELKGLYTKAGRFADETFKKALLTRGIKSDDGTYFLIEKYSDRLAKGKVGNLRSRLLRKKIESSDPNNLSGAHRKLAILDFRALCDGCENKTQPEQVIIPLLAYLKEFGPRDQSYAWKIELMISQYLFGKDRLDEALIHARSSFTMAPESAKGEIVRSIEYLQVQINKESSKG